MSTPIETFNYCRKYSEASKNREQRWRLKQQQRQWQKHLASQTPVQVVTVKKLNREGKDDANSTATTM